jgi:hypothetical protein
LSSLYTMFTLQTSFNPLLLKGGGGGEAVVEVPVNSKEENSSKTFVPITSKNSFLNFLALFRPHFMWWEEICRHSVLFCMNVCSEVGEKGRVVYQEKRRLFRFFTPWLSAVLHHRTPPEWRKYIFTVHTVRYGTVLCVCFLAL